MTEVAPSELKKAVESQHGGRATYVQSVPVHEEHNGQVVWDGAVAIFDTNGNFIREAVAVGTPQLNLPWGVAIAPAGFGSFANDLLIGNFGDGTINAFDPASGQSLGTINLSNGTTFVQPGLWGIAFGNGLDNQPTNTLFFAAGPNDEANGVYGRIDVKM